MLLRRACTRALTSLNFRVLLLLLLLLPSACLSASAHANPTLALLSPSLDPLRSHGFVIGHVVPEAQVGGPIALVEDGDVIAVDATTNTIDLRVSEEELARRRAKWVAPPAQGQPGHAVQVYEGRHRREPTGASPTRSAWAGGGARRAEAEAEAARRQVDGAGVFFRLRTYGAPVNACATSRACACAWGGSDDRAALALTIPGAEPGALARVHPCTLRTYGVRARFEGARKGKREKSIYPSMCVNRCVLCFCSTCVCRLPGLAG